MESIQNPIATTEKKKVIFSGMQPSGTLTLGNYIGALRNWKNIQDDYSCLFCVVDLHALTVKQDPKVLRQKCLELLMLYMACGIKPENNLLFIQSHVSAHAELAWIFNCFTYMGELGRMTQFKEKSQKNESNINAGLFTYPVLMAADILLYQTDLVPVGQDQKQHLELARDIATRFNNTWGQTFKVPEPYITKLGAKIMSLQEPEKKMSKSDDNINSFISLLDDTDTIIRKFKRAVTDSDGFVKYDVQNKPGISNLLDIYASLTGKSIDESEIEFEGKGYGEFKLAVGEACVEAMRPMHAKFDELSKNKDYVEKIYIESAQKATVYAQRTLSKVYKKLGLVPLRRDC